MNLTYSFGRNISQFDDSHHGQSIIHSFSSNFLHHTHFPDEVSNVQPRHQFVKTLYRNITESPNKQYETEFNFVFFHIYIFTVCQVSR